jgi:hypothetical protein
MFEMLELEGQMHMVIRAGMPDEVRSFRREIGEVRDAVPTLPRDEGGWHDNNKAGIRLTRLEIIVYISENGSIKTNHFAGQESHRHTSH